jgi:AcrR family transcriptional regulator
MRAAAACCQHACSRRPGTTFSPSAATTDDPSEQLRAVARAFASWHATHRTTARIVRYELGALTPEHLAALRIVRRQIDQTVRDAIERGVARRDFDVADVPGATLAILSLGVDVARWFRPEGRRTPEQVGEFYAGIALRIADARVQDVR